MDIETRESLLSPDSCQISTKRNLWNLFPLDVQLEVFRCLRAYDLYKHGINVSRQWRNTIEYHKNTLPKLRRIQNDYRALNRLAGDTYFEYRQCEIEEFRKERRLRFRCSVAFLLPSILGYILALFAQWPLSIDKIIATTLLLSITFGTFGTYRKFILFSPHDKLEIFGRYYSTETFLCAKQLKYIWPVYLVARLLVFGGVGILKSQSYLKGDQLFNAIIATFHLPEAFYLVHFAYVVVKKFSTDEFHSTTFHNRLLWTSFKALWQMLAIAFLHLWLPDGITLPLAGDTCLEFRQQQAEETRKREIALQERLRQERHTRFQYSVAFLLPSILGYVLALVAQRPLSTEKVIATTLLLSVTFTTLGTYKEFFCFRAYYQIQLFNRMYLIRSVFLAKQFKYIWPVYLLTRSLIFGGVGVLQGQYHLQGERIFYTLLSITHLPETFYLINDTYISIRKHFNHAPFYIYLIWTPYTAKAVDEMTERRNDTQCRALHFFFVLCKLISRLPLILNLLYYTKKKWSALR